jgi:hypothetical protein
MAETVDETVARLSAEQKRLDEETRKHADEIVAGQSLKDMVEAKRFCSNWIQTAMQHARNESYWRTRALAAEGGEPEGWDVDPQTGRSNSSPAFQLLKGHIGDVIQHSAFDLLRHGPHYVAGLILAKLVHVEGMRPKKPTP